MEGYGRYHVQCDCSEHYLVRDMIPSKIARISRELQHLVVK